MHRSHRVAGAIVGSAVGDALGAPFEFGPAGEFSARFPTPARGVHPPLAPRGRRRPVPSEARPAACLGESVAQPFWLQSADNFEMIRIGDGPEGLVV